MKLSPTKQTNQKLAPASKNGQLHQIPNNRSPLATSGSREPQTPKNSPKASPDKSESPALPGKPIPRDVDVPDFAAALEHAPQILRRRPVRQVVHFQGHHSLDAGRRPPVTHFRLLKCTPRSSNHYFQHFVGEIARKFEKGRRGVNGVKRTAEQNGRLESSDAIFWGERLALARFHGNNFLCLSSS